jgi:tetratricopeptide (TPR) repeat protein
MKLDPILTRASRFAFFGKYEAAIRTLEPEVNRYHGSFRYYYLLGVSCLRAGDFGGALTWFRLAHDAKIRDPLALLGLAVLYLRRGETDRAVDFYLEVQDIDAKNKTAQRALRIIRRRAGTDTFSVWLESGKLPALYPSVPFAGFFPRQIAACILTIVAASVLTLGILVHSRMLPNPFQRRGNRQALAELSLSREEQNAPVQTGGSYRYIVTGSQALETYEKALSLFTAYRDEAAKISLNRLLESNASEGLKNRARIILSYTEAPGFDTFRRSDNVPYADTVKDPALYRDVYVIWRGMATNIETTGSSTVFDFLVGYDTRKILEGIVPVRFDRAVALNSERPLEVLGRIIPVSAEGPIQLEGVAIHQSGRLEN